MVDAELDQLLDEDEEENYVGGGGGGGKERDREGKTGRGSDERRVGDSPASGPASVPAIAVTPLVSRQRERAGQRSLKVTPIVTQRKHLHK